MVGTCRYHMSTPISCTILHMNPTWMVGVGLWWCMNRVALLSQRCLCGGGCIQLRRLDGHMEYLQTTLPVELAYFARNLTILHNKVLHKERCRTNGSCQGLHGGEEGQGVHDVVPNCWYRHSFAATWAFYFHCAITDILANTRKLLTIIWIGELFQSTGKIMDHRVNWEEKQININFCVPHGHMRKFDFKH